MRFTEDSATAETVYVLAQEIKALAASRARLRERLRVTERDLARELADDEARQKRIEALEADNAALVKRVQELEKVNAETNADLLFHAAESRCTRAHIHDDPPVVTHPAGVIPAEDVQHVREALSKPAPVTHLIVVPDRGGHKIACGAELTSAANATYSRGEVTCEKCRGGIVT